MFGIINDRGEHYSDEWSRGVSATTFELNWKQYEPQPGVYDQNYIDHMRQVLVRLKTQGWFVQMIPGYQYVPDWVFNNYPDMAFVNQYGDRYLPDPITQGALRVINAPFNPHARELISGFIARIFNDFNQADPQQRFDSVRIGGGVQGELRYPPPQWNGHRNSYWAYDIYAQDPSISGIPAIASGWRPGIDANPGSVGRGQLILNPGFELEPGYLLIPGWAPDERVKASLTGEEPSISSQALRLEISAPYRIHQYVRIEPALTYEFGGWLRLAQADGSARIFFTQVDANSNPIPNSPFGKLESNSQSWQMKSGSLTTTSATRFIKIELDGDRPGVYYFDNLWLKRKGDTNNLDRDISVPQAFYEWYVDSLTNYMNWQISEIRRYYTGQLDVTIAGKGLQPNQVNDALTNDLRGDSWSESNSALYSGSLYDHHVAGLGTTQNLALYTTGVEDIPPSQIDDNSPYPSAWSAARWIAYLAHIRNLLVWGENGGSNSEGDLQIAVQRMRANHFLGLMWAFESELYANAQGLATIDQYHKAITTYSNMSDFYIPVVIRQCN